MNIDKSCDDLVALSKELKATPETDRVFLLKNYLYNNNLSIEIADELLDFYSCKHKLDFTCYSYAMHSAIFAGFAIGFSFNKLFGEHSSILGIISGAIALILSCLNSIKIMKYKKVSLIRYTLSKIQLNK